MSDPMGGYVAPAFSLVGDWGVDAIKVLCPICGDECQHHGRVLTYDRRGGEDGETVVYSGGSVIVGDDLGNPSPRRDGVRIEFSGECGHEWSLVLIQHKGETFLFWERGEPDYARMPYDEYLKTQRWQERRAMALEAAGYRCQLCNSGERLNVHHRTYDRRGNEAAGDLTVLCSSCHSAFHGRVGTVSERARGPIPIRGRRR